METNGLKFYILPGRNPDIEALSIYNEAYRAWKETWEDAAKDVSALPKDRDSTEFTRQDKVLAVFDEGRCTSLGFWTELDFRCEPTREDYYFRNWTKSALKKLAVKGPWIGMYSYLTVAKDYRAGNRFGISFKDLQISMFVKYFQNSNVDAMTGCTRNNRGVNSVCQRGGAELLEAGKMQFGCETDLMAWYHHSAKVYEPLKDLSVSLWNERVEIGRLSSQYRFNTQLNRNEIFPNNNKSLRL